MPIEQLHLSPAYAAAMIRLTSADSPPWPGLLLHAQPLTAQPHTPAGPAGDVIDVQRLAHRAGLHPVADPFTSGLPPVPWTFRLPTLRRDAELTSPHLRITLTRSPVITDDWWRMAVSHGGQCRLLVAFCVTFPDDPADAADVLNEAAAAGRVHGATISVEF